jgi:NADPH:quinone reductase-like Zn-dependent oxidoreductase
MSLPATNLTLLSQLKDNGTLEVTLSRLPMPVLRNHEVLVEIKATPINPSDLSTLIGAANAGTMRASERDGLPVLTADVPAAGMRTMAGRIGEAMPTGNEGCGVVVAAGSAPQAQALLHKTVAITGGAIHARYRALPAMSCLVLPDGIDPADGASSFVNPMTALMFVHLMRSEGHKAIVHTAAASNLGQMLVKLCAVDGVPLVNIVRGDEQAQRLKEIGATHVVNSSADNFLDDLTDKISETGATLAFDAIGGGELAGQILACMEASAARRLARYNRYGSDTFKQVYIYGMLDPSPTVLARDFGFTWAVSGLQLTTFMQKAGSEAIANMRKRVVNELTTTFKSQYSHEISLAQALDPEIFAAYNAKRTGQKFLIRP